MPELQQNLCLKKEEYVQILRGLLEGLKGLSLEPEYLNSLLTLLEGWTSGVPSSTARTERADIPSMTM